MCSVQVVNNPLQQECFPKLRLMTSTSNFLWDGTPSQGLEIECGDEKVYLKAMFWDKD